MNDLNAPAGLRAYLRAYSNGQYAAEARSRIENTTIPTPEERARTIEDGLSLSFDDRWHIQENLTFLGFDTRGVDGVFGRSTQSAIVSWQEENGLSETGYLTDNRIVTLEKQSAGRARELAKEARDGQAEIETQDRQFWVTLGGKAGDAAGLHRYLREYPDGLFSEHSRNRLAALREANRKKSDRAERALWEQAEASGSIDGYRKYLEHHPSGFFAEKAHARIEALNDTSSRKEINEAAKNEEASLGLNGLDRVLLAQKLTALGFDAGLPDGVFDELTRPAVRQFQRARGFPVTGFVTR